MFEKIKIVPLAAESLGVRSMCTYVETPDVRILLDPGASLAPNRFGFPPHPREYQALAECRRRISEAARRAEIVTISHYHFDHHTPSYEDWCYNWSSSEVARQIYDGKLLLIKSYRTKVNFSQRRRGWIFEKTGGSHAKRIEVADGRTFEFGDTTLRFSEPVFHGPKDSALGWVLMVAIEHDDEKMLFAPDVQGPMYGPTLRAILKEEPQLVVIGGPPIYLSGFRVPEEHIRLGMKNLQDIARSIPTTILEHHLLREESWRTFSKPVFDVAARNHHRVMTAAEFRGIEDRVLESRRKELFEREPPSSEFERWMKLPHSKRKLIKPPI